MKYQDRKVLPHEIPSWVPSGSNYFITICCDPSGKNQLCHKDTADSLLATVDHYQQLQKWWVHLFLLMPDHLHAIISFSKEEGMRKTVGQWKRYASGSFGIQWQRGFFDHRLRSDESFDEKAFYIRQNPVRAGLVADSKDWTYCR